MNFLLKHSNLLAVLPIALILFACGNSKKIQAPQSSGKLPFKEAFHQANSEKMIGHLESAEELFKKCLVLNPSSDATHFALAGIYKEQKLTSKSIEYCKNAFNINQNNKWYSAFLADTYFEIGDYHNSAKYYEILVYVHKDLNIENQSKLAQSFIYSNQIEKAIKVLDKMELELGSTPMTSLTKHDLFIELGKNKQAEESLQKLFTENPYSTSIGLEAMDYFLRTAQYDKAMKAIDHIQKIDATNVHATIGEAEVNLAQGKIDQSFELLSKSLPSEEIEEGRKLTILESLIGMSLDTRFPKAEQVNSKLKNLMGLVYPNMEKSARFLSLYGQYLIQNGEKDSALIFYTKAVEIDPNDYQAWINLMDANYASNEFQKLNHDADKALAIFPNQPMLYLLKGIAEYELNNYSNAQDMLNYGQQLVIEDKDLNAEFNYHLAKNKWKQNEKSEAATLFEKAFQNNPANSRFYYGYAKLLEEDLMIDKALQYAKKASNLNNSQANYAAFYANLLIEVKDFELAKKMLERALSADLDNTEYLERYGDVMFFLNDIEKAVDTWRQTNQIQPSSRLDLKILTKSYHE